jgi:hypothetical protein
MAALSFLLGGLYTAKAQENPRAPPPREGGGGGGSPPLIANEASGIAFVLHAVEAVGATHGILAVQVVEGVARKRTRCALSFFVVEGVYIQLCTWPWTLRTGIRPLCGLWWGDQARREEPIRAICRCTGFDGTSYAARRASHSWPVADSRRPVELPQRTILELSQVVGGLHSR